LRGLGSPKEALRRGKQTEELDPVAVWRSIVDPWKKLQRDYEKNLMGADLNFAELRILRMLEKDDSIPMNRFCQETMLSQPTITGVVDKLEERALVERVRSREDRREVLIAITQKGRGALERGEALHRQFVERSLSALRGEELELLAGLLKRLAEASDSP
jgi:DNA-binding MarR family transcriptional regulator